MQPYSYSASAYRQGDWFDGVVSFLFSAKGRVRRRYYWLFSLVSTVVCAVALVVALRAGMDTRAAAASGNPGGGLAYVAAELVTVWVAMLLTAWCSVVVTIKRWRRSLLEVRRLSVL